MEFSIYTVCTCFNISLRMIKPGELYQNCQLCCRSAATDGSHKEKTGEIQVRIEHFCESSVHSDWFAASASTNVPAITS